MSRHALIFACVGLLASAEADSEGCQNQDLDDFGLLQTDRSHRPNKGKGKYANFAFRDRQLGSIKGKFFVGVVGNGKEKAVAWKVEGLKIDSKVIEKGCGKLLEGKPEFNYHLHEEWNFGWGKRSSAFDCSLENVGNHWDPTAACGPASGNQVCDEDYCNTRGKNYTCNPKKFNPYSIAQYRLLSPSKIFPDDVTCEFGDFSGMAGPILAAENEHTKEVFQNRPHGGKAAMSASFGEITPETVGGKHCSYGTLPKEVDDVRTYEHATVTKPLDQFPKRASVLVHCGKNYEKSNARFFCARLH